MALQEHDREDLLRDATAMPIRGLWKDAADVEWFVGFRATGAMSIYVGADLVIQFDHAGHLRRLYFRGQKYAVLNDQLMRLTRTDRGARVVHQSDAVLDADLHSITDELTAVIETLKGATRISSAVCRQEPTGLDPWAFVGATIPIESFARRVAEALASVLPIRLGTAR
jgi:hypothetical protein